MCFQNGAVFRHRCSIRYVVLWSLILRPAAVFFAAFLVDTEAAMECLKLNSYTEKVAALTGNTFRFLIYLLAPHPTLGMQ